MPFPNTGASIRSSAWRKRAGEDRSCACLATAWQWPRAHSHPRRGSSVCPARRSGTTASGPAALANGIGRGRVAKSRLRPNPRPYFVSANQRRDRRSDIGLTSSGTRRLFIDVSERPPTMHARRTALEVGGYGRAGVPTLAKCSGAGSSELLRERPHGPDEHTESMRGDQPGARAGHSRRCSGRELPVRRRGMTETRRTTGEEAKRVGDEIGVDWSRFDLEQFRFGMGVEIRARLPCSPDGRNTRRPDPDWEDRSGTHEGVPRLLRAPGAHGKRTRRGTRRAIRVTAASDTLVEIRLRSRP